MERTLTAFAAESWIGTGDEDEVRAAILAMGGDAPTILIFDDATGRQVDIALRGVASAANAGISDGSGDSIGDRAQVPQSRGRGRPRLGVQAREVTLLPRHWDWLATQPGGASVTLRRLVEAARREACATPSPRAAMDAAYHFLTAMAGDRPGYEAAIRALYARDAAAFDAACASWPSPIRAHGAALAAPAFADGEDGR
ncbi:DUF2239 family protein [Sphingobium aquiterrae]|uniref:DUF2239 family protein n=1 Tax=Sphingobium aquiterrae TaxID=2038656 RepID=UPI003016CE9C